MGKQQSQASLSEIHNSVDTTTPGKSRWRRVLAFSGQLILSVLGIWTQATGQLVWRVAASSDIHYFGFC